MAQTALGHGQIHTRAVTVGTSPTLLNRSAGALRFALVVQQCADSASAVYLGGSTVSASSDATLGYLLLAPSDGVPPDSFPDALSSGDLYGVVASGTGRVVVMEVY